MAAMTFASICVGELEIPAPLSVAHRIEMKAGGPAAVLERQNPANRAVVAYAVRLAKRGENGKVVSVRTRAVSTKGLGAGLGRPSFRAGERWSEALDLPEGRRWRWSSTSSCLKMAASGGRTRAGNWSGSRGRGMGRGWNVKLRRGEGSIPAGSGLLGQGNRRPLVHPQGPDA